jgi:hypothetical protein
MLNIGDTEVCLMLNFMIEYTFKCCNHLIQTSETSPLIAIEMSRADGRWDTFVFTQHQMKHL